MAELTREQIEAERRKREEELILLLLLLMDDAEQDVIAYVRNGGSPEVPLRAALAAVVPIIAEGMADAHEGSFRLLSVATGELITEPRVSTLVKEYEPQAQAAADAMVATLTDAIEAQRRESQDATADVIVRAAFESAGYVSTASHGLDSGAERAVVLASNNGMIGASRLSPSVTGLTHVSRMDERTTDICRERHGLTLPVDDPYWQSNIPSLHWRCRSIVLPVFGKVTYSTSLPTIPPMPGFGIAPAGFFTPFRRGEAA